MSEKPPQNIDELLQMFVSTDELRPKFMQPWRERNQVFASEYHILIRVNSYLTNADYPQYDSGNTNKLFPSGTPDGIITPEQLTDALAKAPLEDELVYKGEDVICDECGGDGMVMWEYKHWSREYDCPKCYGDGYLEHRKAVATGRKIIDKAANIKIGPFCFRAHLLDMLLDAMKYCGCSEVAVTFGSETSATRFNLTDEIDIILMPVQNAEAYTSLNLIDSCF